MLDTSNVSLNSTSDAESCSRRRSIFYIPLSDSFISCLPQTEAPTPAIKTPPVSTPAPQRFLLRARKSMSKSTIDDSKNKIFNTFPTKIPPKNLGLSKCSSDIDFSEASRQESGDNNSEKRYTGLKLSLPVNSEELNKMDNQSKTSATSKSQNDISSAMLVKVQAKEIEVRRSPLKSSLSCSGSMPEVKITLKKERSFIGLSTSKSASRVNLSPSDSRCSKTSLLSASKVLKSNSKSNISLSAVEGDRKSGSQISISRTPSKSGSGSSLFLSPSRSDVSTLDKPTKSPGFSLIRRSHSTKLTRSNSLLKPFSKSEPEDIDGPIVNMSESDYFAELLKQYDESEGKINLVDAMVYGTLVHGGDSTVLSPIHGRKSAIRSCLDAEEEAIHSGTL